MDDGRPAGLEGQDPRSALEEVVREGARQMLAQALELEVSEYLQKHADKTDETGRRMVVRNGYLPQRQLLSGVGPLTIRQPRVDDRALANGQEERFSSSILPKYLKRMPSVSNLIPVLYLKGISTGDFTEALAAILGPAAPGLSATNIVRMKAGWEAEYRQWCKRRLSKRYVYLWADGMYTNVRLDDERSCILMIMGADERGDKELLAVSDGFRESAASWKEMLLDLKERGLTVTPKLAIADGALGFWAALRQVYPDCGEQTCWFHKSGNVLDKLPKSVQSKAKAMLRQMWQAPSREEALRAYHHFGQSWQDKYPKAVACLKRDEAALFRFYDLPAAHWIHIRTTNPIESTYATVRHRTRRTKGCGSRTATLTMVWRLALEAQKTWRRLTGAQQLSLVMQGVKFVDGELQEAA